MTGRVKHQTTKWKSGGEFVLCVVLFLEEIRVRPHALEDDAGFLNLVDEQPV